jgi:hypothetical protein
MAAKNCWDEVTTLPCMKAGALQDSRSPIVANGWAVIAQLCAPSSQGRWSILLIHQNLMNEDTRHRRRLFIAWAKTDGRTITGTGNTSGTWGL